jgi:hypothetical protein
MQSSPSSTRGESRIQNDDQQRKEREKKAQEDKVTFSKIFIIDLRIQERMEREQQEKRMREDNERKEREENERKEQVWIFVSDLTF